MGKGEGGKGLQHVQHGATTTTRARTTATAEQEEHEQCKRPRTNASAERCIASSSSETAEADGKGKGAGEWRNLLACRLFMFINNAALSSSLLLPSCRKISFSVRVAQIYKQQQQQ